MPISGKKIAKLLIFSGLYLLICLSSFARGVVSHIVHDHHHFGEHSHMVGDTAELAHEKWKESGSHLRLAHAEKIPVEVSHHGDEDSESIPSKPLPEPIKLTLHLQLYLSTQQLNVSAEHDLEPLFVSAVPNRTLSRVLLSDTQVSNILRADGMPPPSSQVVRILLSNHALLI